MSTYVTKYFNDAILSMQIRIGNFFSEKRLDIKKDNKLNKSKKVDVSGKVRKE